MSKANVLALVQTLSGERADQTTSERFYDEILNDLGQAQILVTGTIVSVGPGLDADPDGSYALPDNCIEPLQFFYDDRFLNPAYDRELVAWNPNWRGLTGMPMVVTNSDVGQRRFRLVPQPDVETKPYIFLFGEPFDTEYPEYAVVVFHTDKRDDQPYWLELAIANLVVAREFSRASDHQDIGFAGRSHQIGETLLGMVR